MDGAGTNGSAHGAKYRSMMELKVKVRIRLWLFRKDNCEWHPNCSKATKALDIVSADSSILTA